MDLDRVDSTRFRKALAPRDDQPSARFEADLEPFQLYPEDINIIADLAYDYLMSGAYEVARVLYRGLVALRPADSHHRLGFGLALDRLGQAEAAERQYTYAARSAPHDPMPLVNLAELALGRSDRDRALRLLEKAASLRHDDERVTRKVRSLLSLLSTPNPKS